jgi:pantetheine-phosphate adenylyltransferase
MTARIGIYPGTFDPVTMGHIDIAQRASKLVDKLIIAVADHPAKKPIFTLEERVDMVRHDVAELNSTTGAIEVIGFDGLLVNVASQHDATILIRGLRAVSDFEYEFQMSCMNTKLNPTLQTVFLPASEKTHFVASRFVKEAVRLGGNISGLVSPHVLQQLTDYFKKSDLK